MLDHCWLRLVFCVVCVAISNAVCTFKAYDVAGGKWSDRLNSDATFGGFRAELGQVDVLGIVLGLERLPLGGTVIHQVLDNLVGSIALLLSALGAVRLQGVGQHSLQLATVWCALSLLHQALEVVIE